MPLQFLRDLGQLANKPGIGRVSGTALGNEHPVAVPRKEVPVAAPRLAEKPFDAVPLHSVAHLAAHCHAHATDTVPGAADYQQVLQVDLAAPALNGQKFPSFAQSRRFGEPLGSAHETENLERWSLLLGCIHCQTVAPPAAAAAKNRPTTPSAHPLAKAVNSGPSLVVRLVRPLHCFTPLRQDLACQLSDGLDNSVRSPCQRVLPPKKVLRGVLGAGPTSFHRKNVNNSKESARFLRGKAGSRRGREPYLGQASHRFVRVSGSGSFGYQGPGVPGACRGSPWAGQGPGGPVR